MLDLFLVRHSITYGNTLGRYIGKRTDEPLTKDGIALLKRRYYPQVQTVFTSPLKRCVQTAALCYPDTPVHTLEELAECDFGEFENKNYKELSGNDKYQEWIDSNGTLPFPGGESREAFMERCQRGFSRCVEYCLREGLHSGALVVHGGTIMSILDAYAVPHQGYYDWQVGNGGGYQVRTSAEEWNERVQELHVVKKLVE